MKHFILLFLILIESSLFAQENKVVIKGRVTDHAHNPIANAFVQNTITGEGSSTDISGHYLLRTSLLAILKASLIGYRTVLKKIVPEQKKDTIEVDFILEIDSSQLQEVAVTATNKPELLKESGDLMDFETRYNKIWLLYRHRKGDNLELYDSAMNYVSKIALKHHATALYKTPHNYLYIANSDSVRLYAYYAVHKSIYSGTMASTQFYPYLKYLTAYSYPYYYYSKYSSDYGSVYFWYYNQEDSTKGKLYKYYNKDLSRNNEEMLGTDDDNKNALELSSEKEWGLTGTGNNNAATPAGYAQSKPKPTPIGARTPGFNPPRVEPVCFDSVYCLLRISKDSIYIFNFNIDSIYLYNHYNKKIRQMPLAFFSKGHKYMKERDVLVDEENGDFYYKFVAGMFGTETYLQKIDLKTGRMTSSQRISSATVHKIRIMSGYVYYTISDKDPNKMYIEQLFRQKL